MSNILANTIVSAGSVWSPGTNTNDASSVANSITGFLTNFIGPILVLAIGIIAIKFLVQRQMTQFFQFAAVAVLVAVLFFTPGLVQNIGIWFGNLFGGFFK